MSRKSPRPVHEDWLVQHSYNAGSVGNGFPAVGLARDGQPHFDSDRADGLDAEWGYYDEEKDKWLSYSRWQHNAKIVGAVAGSATPTGSNSLWLDYQGAALVRYGNNVGWQAPYKLELMSMSVRLVAAMTCDISLAVNNGAHTGATITLTSTTNAEADGFTAATILKGSYIGFYVSSGTATSGTIDATFRRVMYE